MTGASATVSARLDRRPQRGLHRLVELFVIGLLLAIALLWMASIFPNWGFEDVDAYWDAAIRLRDGEPLYGGVNDPDNYRVFRYAPWFAWLWIPLTYLPRSVAEYLWAGLLGASAIGILLALFRRYQPAAWALGLILAPMLLSLVQVGNIQPLVVAMLGFGISHRSGPLWVGIAASLKAVPILYALVYVARRQWSRVALSVGIAAILVAPMLLSDLSGYTSDPGRSFSIYYFVSPLAWLIAAIGSSIAAILLAWRRSPYVWLAIAVAVMLVAPRSHVTYATFFAIGLLAGDSDRIADRGAGHP